MQNLQSPIRRLRQRHLKLCPLCGTVSARRRTECVVCGWYGRFDHDPERISEGVRDIVDHCPELIQVLAPPRRPGPWARLRRALGLDRGFDIRS
jgi:hypothetical protein